MVGKRRNDNKLMTKWSSENFQKNRKKTSPVRNFYETPFLTGFKISTVCFCLFPPIWPVTKFGQHKTNLNRLVLTIFQILYNINLANQLAFLFKYFLEDFLFNSRLLSFGF